MATGLTRLVVLDLESDVWRPWRCTINTRLPDLSIASTDRKLLLQ